MCPPAKIRRTARSLIIILAADLQGTSRSRFSTPPENSVRRYSSADQPPYTLEEQSKSGDYLTYWIQEPKILSAESGMHRWVWNLHYTTPETMGHGYPIVAVPHDTPLYPLGPRALPGVYTVKLTANGHTYSQTLTVKGDKRVHATPLALAAQFAMERQLASGMDDSYDALQQVRNSAKILLSRVAATKLATSKLPLSKAVADSAGAEEVETLSRR